MPPYLRVPSFIAQFLGWARAIGRVYNCTPRIPDICYRGHGRKDWKLLPTLCRDRTQLGIALLRQDESDIIMEFRSRFQLHEWKDVEVMAYAQHHGAPTRLLDWTKNALIGLWFAVSDKADDDFEGSVYQLHTCPDCKVFAAMTEPPSTLIAGGDFKSEGGCPVHLFASPPRVERAGRQGSVFSFANFEGDYAISPLEKILESEKSEPLRVFSVPAEFKLELRRLLLDLGLDAYSIYGGPDFLGKAITSRLYLPTCNISVDSGAKENHPAG
jgi:hypothetical protein